jgi:hypothetical protein
MEYKDLKKASPTHRVIGYCLMNFNKRGSCHVIKVGTANSLIVLNKVRHFEYMKGFTPCEVSYEDVLYAMANFGAMYSFDKTSLDKFIYYSEKELGISQENLNEVKKMKEWQPQDEHELYTIGNDIDLENENLLNFNLN